MKKSTGWLIAAIAFAPFLYLFSKISPEQTIILRRSIPDKTVIISLISILIIGLSILTLRKHISNDRKLLAMLFAITAEYSIFTSQYLYYDVMEYRAFSDNSTLKSFETPVYSIQTTHLRGSTYHSATLELQSLNRQRSQVAITDRLFDQIASVGEKHSRATLNKCSLIVQVQSNRYESRIVHFRAFDVGDSDLC